VIAGAYNDFVPVETGMNAPQFTYLIPWWCHNRVTSHIMKFLPCDCM